MALSVEKTGKTVDEARQAALFDLGVPEERASFEILEEPSKGFFGLIGGRPARVRATVLALSPLDKGEDFLRRILSAMALPVTIERREVDGAVLFDIKGESLGILIGKHGQTLDALQYLANLAANQGLVEERLRILLDVEHYRDRREETLKSLGRRLAEKVRRTGVRVVLEPMNRHERKIIHLALQENDNIVTYSAGDEPFRKVVIEPRRRRSERGGEAREEFS